MPKFTSHEFCIEYLLLECMSIYHPFPRDTFWRLASSSVLFCSTLQDKTFQVFSVFWVVSTAVLLLWQIYCLIILFPPSSCQQHHHGSVRMWQKYRSSALISGLLLFYNYNSLLRGNRCSSTLLVFRFPHLFFSSPVNSFQIVHLAAA